MKIKNFIILLIITPIFLYSCSSSKKYDVSELENADSAFFGWMKDDLNNTHDYELRFYDTHYNAIKSINLIEEVIGENAVLASRDVTWKEGNSDRRVNRRGAGSGPGSAKAKYLHYWQNQNLKKDL